MTEQNPPIAARTVQTDKILPLTPGNGVDVGVDTLIVDVEFAGPWAAPQTADVLFTVVGTTVNMVIGELTAAATGTTEITSAVVIPAAYRPTVAQVSLIAIADNSVNIAGNITIGTDGILIIAPFAGTFTATNNANVSQQTICYNIA